MVDRKYEDMLDLPHHQSAYRPQMTMENRAAQFSPFAALVGYGDAVKETARLTDRESELDEQALERLDEKLQRLELLPESREVELEITRFIPDARKSGGRYEMVIGMVRNIDAYRRVLKLTDGNEIPVEQIVDMEFL